MSIYRCRIGDNNIPRSNHALDINRMWRGRRRLGAIDPKNRTGIARLRVVHVYIHRMSNVLPEVKYMYIYIYENSISGFVREKTYYVVLTGNGCGGSAGDVKLTYVPHVSQQQSFSG